MKTLSKGTRVLTTVILIVLNALSIAASYFIALWLRHDFMYSAIETKYIDTYLQTIWIWVLICTVVFACLKLYNNLLTFAGQDDLIRIIAAYLIIAVIGVICVAFFDPTIFKANDVGGEHKMPLSYYLLGYVFSFIGTIIIHFGWRIIDSLSKLFSKTMHSGNVERIMVIGAGLAGRMMLREYNESDKIFGKVVCFIDDDEEKIGRRLDGVPVVGGRDMVVKAAEQYNISKIIYAIPSGSGKTKKEYLDICCKTGCSVEIVPGIYQLVNGQVSANKARRVEIRDLLGRDAVEVNMDEIYRYISGKVVMVTGGGGSIGSELCRQIALSCPKLLLIFDIYENNAYEIQQELRRKYPDLNMEVLIGSVRNTARLDYVLGKYKPDIVFHAAAHKHVPLMEDSPNEAVKNNVFGTYKMAKAAVKYGVKKFVLISTDKAVNPTNIMGASKRLCEMVVQMMNRESPNTEFVAVRFGNVLGSNGSVIPLFEKQIAEGGPVTVTHPDITRFFMTIPEAVSLVLQAGYYAKGGEIYVLDMGQPVKIADMARNLIRLSGYEPDYDIRIEYTGLRPGEKLYEELLMDEEGLQDTDNKLIHIGKPIEMDDEVFKKQLERLEEAYKSEVTNMKDIVAEIVPTYKRNPQ